MTIRTVKRSTLFALVIALGTAEMAEASPTDDERAAVVEWFEARAQPIDSVEPVDDATDLDGLAGMIGDARIVGLGEATHGTGDFFTMKHRIVRHLVERLGFTHFAIEANFAECRAVDAYITRGEGTARGALRGLGAWTWATEEVLAMIEWMRAHNQRVGAQPPIRFVGIDMTRSAGAAADLLTFLEAVDFEFAEDEWSLAADLRACLEPIAAGQRLDRSDEADASRDELLGILRERFEEYAEEYADESSEEDVAFARHGLTVVEQALRGFTDRDRYMAENTSWLLEQAGPTGKLMVWAHNGHVARNGLNMLSGSQGHHLTRRHGDDYVAFGFSFLEGSFQCMSGGKVEGFEVGPHVHDSMDAVLSECGHPRAFYDLRAPEPGSAIHRWLHRPQKLRTVGGGYSADMEEKGLGATTSIPAEAFDVVIFLRSTQRATPLREGPGGER